MWKTAELKATIEGQRRTNGCKWWVNTLLYWLKCYLPYRHHKKFPVKLWWNNVVDYPFTSTQVTVAMLSTESLSVVTSAPEHRPATFFFGWHSYFRLEILYKPAFSIPAPIECCHWWNWQNVPTSNKICLEVFVLRPLVFYTYMLVWWPQQICFKTFCFKQIHI